MSTTCARCGADDCEANSLSQPFGIPSTVIACRDRQIAAQSALLRSVTGKLEEAAELLSDIDSATCGEVSEPLDIINSVLEVLS